MKKRTFFLKLLWWLDLYRLASIANAGRFFWLWPLIVPLVWLVIAVTIPVKLRWWDAPSPEMVQLWLLGVPMAVVGIFLGLRIIGGELNARTIEIVYTVPGGAEKVWRTKLFAAGILLLCMEAVMALYIWLVLTPFPLETLYGSFQIAVFYMAISMSFAALFRSEVSGAVVAVAVGALNLVVTGFGSNQLRWTPFFNPHDLSGQDLQTVIAWTLQNRIGVFLVILGVLGLGFMRGNRREKLLAA